ncbi:hypothetical protein D3C77_197160 [compost metagenome]
MGLVHDVHVGDATGAHARTQCRIRLIDLRVERHVEQLPVRRDANPHPMGANPGNDRINHFKDKAQATFQRIGAIAIGAVIDQGVEELLDEVAVGAMDFNAIETGFNGVVRGLGKVFDHPGDFLGGQRAWRRSGDKARFTLGGIAEGDCPLGNLAGGTDGSLAVELDRGVRHAPHMPELGKHLAANAVNGVSDQLPALNLLRGVDPRIEQIALAFTGDRRAFRNDQAGRATLGVMQRHLLGGDVLRRPRTGHRGHDETVVQRQSGKVVRSKQVNHESGLLNRLTPGK